ncbi:MAG: 6-phosphogluconolactonase [Bacteroidales bacterium]
MRTEIFEDAAATARGLSHELLRLMQEKEGKPFFLAISGGSTPSLWFRILANEFAERINWNALRLFWVDERCVEPTHPESNYGVAKQLLLDRVPLAPEQVFRIYGEAHPAEEANRYSAQAESFIPATNGVLRFDLVVAGLGTDGHTSSIFPGQEALLTCKSSYAVSEHPVSKQRRVALTGQPMIGSRNLLFHLTGGEKSAILQQVLHPSAGGKMLPSAYILERALNPALFIDRAAAAGGK